MRVSRAGVPCLAILAFAAGVFSAPAPRSVAEEPFDGPLSPSAKGYYTQWSHVPSGTVKYQTVAEADCAFTDASYVASSTGGDRVSFAIETGPANAERKVSRVELTVCQRVSGATMVGASYAPFVRIDGVNYDGAVTAIPSGSGCVETTQSISLPQPVARASGAPIEIGAVKAAGDARAARICSIRATIYYEDDAPPPPPPLPTVAIAPAGYDSTAALWDITIDNSAAGAIPRNGLAVAVSESDSVLAGDQSAGPCFDTAAGSWACDVTAGAVASFRVARPRSALASACAGGALPNWLESAQLADGTPLPVSGGDGGGEAHVTIPPVLQACPLPLVRLQSHSPPLSAGFAYWEVVITQPPAEGLPRTLALALSSPADLVDASPGASCSAAGPLLSCSIPATGETTIVVRRAAVAANLSSGGMCNGGLIHEHLASASLDDGRPVGITAGDQPGAVAYPVLDTSACDPLAIAKSLAPSATPVVEDHEAVAWLLTVENPPGGRAGAAIALRDPGTVTMEGPILAGAAASCTGNLQDPGGVSCELQPGSSATWTVRPSVAPRPACDARTYSNTAAYQLPGTSTWVDLPGPGIELRGDDALCSRALVVAYHYFPPSLPVVAPGLALAGIAAPLPCQRVDEPDGSFSAWACDVPSSWHGAVETAPAPGWVEGACPESLIAPPAAERRCAYRSGRLSASVTLSAAGLPARESEPPLLELDGITLPPAPDGAAGHPAWGPLTLSPLAPHTAVLTFDQSRWRLLPPPTITGDGCEVGEGTFAGEILVTVPPGRDCAIDFALERLSATLVVEQRYIGAFGEPPEFGATVDGAPHAASWEATGSPLERWQTTVPVIPAGSLIKVGASAPAGWAIAAAAVGDCNGLAALTGPLRLEDAPPAVVALPGDQISFCFVNVAVGGLALNAGAPAGTSETAWRFTSSIPGLAGFTLDTAPGNESAAHSRTFSLLPAGDYTISMPGGRPACLPGAMASDFQTSVAIAGGPAAVVGGGPVPFTIPKGQIIAMAFTNTPCAEVLPPGLLEITLIEDRDGDGAFDPGEPLLAGWPVAITGPDGDRSILSDGAGPARYSVAAGGEYLSRVEPLPGWKASGPASLPVAAGLGEVRQLMFFLQPRVAVRVMVRRLTPEHPEGVPTAGWLVTLSGCGVQLNQHTGADGAALFPDVPAAHSCGYTASLASRPGWVLPATSAASAPVLPGETAAITFFALPPGPCLECVPPLPEDPGEAVGEAPPVVLAPGATLLAWSGDARAIEDAIENAGVVAAVYHWDAASGAWRRYLPGLPLLSDLLAFEPGASYWVVIIGRAPGPGVEGAN